MGLVNAVTSIEDVKIMAMEASLKLAAKDPFALNAARRLMRGEPENYWLKSTRRLNYLCWRYKGLQLRRDLQLF